MQDPHLAVLTEEVRSKYDCHTVILCDARPFAGTYLDLFVYPIAKLQAPRLMHVRGGRVLVEKDGVGSRFLARLDRLHAAGPKPLASDERQARQVWAHKMLNRIRAGDVEGNYRRVWLLTALLEDYFVLRGRWYEGARESLRWLGQNDPAAQEAFMRALQPGADLREIQLLVKIVSGD